MELLQKLGAILERFQFLEERMADPEVVTNISEYKKISKEYKDLEQIMKLFHEYKKNLSNIEGAKEILGSGDKEMVEMASEELASAEAEVTRLEEELKLLLKLSILIFLIYTM